MNIDYPNPWNFDNTDENLISPDGKYKIQFGALSEIAMWGPLSGNCFLIYAGKKIKLNDWTGGPVIWHYAGHKIGLPIWTESRNHKIRVADVSNLTLNIFRVEFSVLHFKKFEYHILSGIDSPISSPSLFYLDIEKEEVEIVKQLKWEKYCSLIKFKNSLLAIQPKSIHLFTEHSGVAANILAWDILKLW